ncbi:hypothetical protein SLEP1_g14772 [Rubroshorea leprosula]|uniref:Uncharacterized protein n=1 Tax=Rubroshorea leprosula TaxID=152421 RepID=A0AAV5IK62_9ROSI|nr:hypothetical protein SLEP1_g14772 [Rubroshorea leprosula]
MSVLNLHPPPSLLRSHLWQLLHHPPLPLFQRIHFQLQKRPLSLLVRRAKGNSADPVEIFGFFQLARTRSEEETQKKHYVLSNKRLKGPFGNVV